MSGISFETLLGYHEAEMERWRSWFDEAPTEVLELPVGTGDTETVAGLILHLVAVELRHTERLLGRPITPYETLPAGDIDGLFDLSAETRAMLTAYLHRATDAELDRVLTFETRSAGTVTTSARKLAAHILLHAIRHWAQIAMVVRQGGFPSPGLHDFLFTDAMP